MRLKILIISFLMFLALTFSFSCKKSAPVKTVMEYDTVLATMADSFTPESISVKKGATIVWVNKDFDDHTVTSDDGTSFNKDPLHPDSTYSFLTTTVGTIPYHCTIHPGMVGTLIVTN